MPQTPPPPGYLEFHEAEFTRLVRRAMRLRLLFSPVVAVLVLVLAASAPSLLLAGTMSAVAFLLLLLSWREDARARQGVIRSRTVTRNLLVVSALQGSMVLLTGGLLSPLVVVLVPLGWMGGFLIGRGPALIGFVALQQGVVWTALIGRWLGILPAGHLPILGLGLDTPAALPHALALGAVLAFVVLASSGLGSGIRSITDGMLWRAFEARQEALQSHRDRLSELSSLSGEIAHELKNPLATIKGLAALLDRGSLTGRDVERLRVLRREVGRMEHTLHEFLNFSRPLLPLEQEPLDAARLLEEVAALHEGVAGERGLTLRVRAPERLGLVADGRKVHQVLVNLVQNALEASPRGAVVDLEASQADGVACLEVRDRGPGLPEGPERAFQPGFTTKAQGSGLGLTLARALARQHGGDLELGEREGGGVRALLLLPLGGADPAQEPT